MKKLNFGGKTGERYMCSRAEVNQMFISGKKQYEVIGVTPKGVVVEFKNSCSEMNKYGVNCG